MPQVVLYIATIAGALALMLALPKQRYTMPRIGAVLGAAAVGFTWLLLRTGPGAEVYGWPGDDGGLMIYYYLFSLIAIGAAGRVITHPRPVYSALWFVLVVLAAAGLFLILSAEFMAVAMVIIYGGAILVTYMFVIMLATSSASSERPAADDADGDYNRLAREPVAATAAGFLLLAALLTVSFERMEPNAAAASPSDEAIIAQVLPERSIDRAREAVAAQAVERGIALSETADAVGPAPLANSERIGLNLFMSHPLGLELAGVVLLVALIGAVVIARTQVPDESAVTAPPDPETGATAGSTREAGPDEPEGIGRIGGRVGT